MQEGSTWIWLPATMSTGSRCTVLIWGGAAYDHVMGNFGRPHWPQPHFRHHLLMCRHLPDGGKLTLTNFHFTRAYPWTAR